MIRSFNLIQLVNIGLIDTRDIQKNLKRGIP